jgi:large subunit ribosomal protein L15
MRLHQVRPQAGSRQRTKRLGRGIASGQGKTAGRGTKGQLARSGPGLPGWFEGGQTPLHMRVPKLRGFKVAGRVEHVALNVGQLAEYVADGKVTPETLAAKGLIRPDEKVKILGDGTARAAFEVHAHAVSATARQKIEAAGGSVVLLRSSPRSGARGAEAEAEARASRTGAPTPGARGASRTGAPAPGARGRALPDRGSD